MKNEKYAILMIALVAIASLYTVSSENSVGDFCILGITCSESSENPSIDDNITLYSLEDYNFTEEGIVRYYFTENDSKYAGFFKSLEEVINISRRDYQEIISDVSSGKDFNEIYHLNTKIFKEKYTTSIDDASPKGEYIQNIGEIVLNDYHGDCDDYALILYLIAKEKGLDVRYVLGVKPGSGHAWIQVKVDGEWIEYDSTSDTICNDCISELFDSIYYFEEGNLVENKDE